jgi:hypothetical protein
MIDDIIDFITKIRKTDKEIALTDIILEYGNKHNIEPEELGDIIADDFYFKQYIEMDCKMNGTFKNEKKNALKEW